MVLVAVLMAALVAVPDGVVAQDRPSLPEGRAIAALEADACRALLTAYEVPFAAVSDEEAQTLAIAQPVRITGPIGGITIGRRHRRAEDAVLDCRLALALLAWAPALRAAGVERIEHYSVFRPGARINRGRSESGHARAMAIDAGRFYLAGNRELDVERVWTDRTRGVDVCGTREEEPEDQAALRNLVCDAVRRDLFQVVLTPHANAEHRNHVHLEVRPGVDWSYVR
jgi:hypothetical protein